jgi:hypothetical protein
MSDADRAFILTFWSAMRIGIGMSAGLNVNNMSENDILKAVGWGDPRFCEDGWLLRFANGITARQLFLFGLLGP